MYDTNDIELVKTLISKTKENKIKWEKGYTDWIFNLSLSDGIEIMLQKSLNDITNRWVLAVSMNKNSKILSEAIFSEPYKRIFPPTFIVDSSFEAIKRDFQLVDSLFETVKQEVDNSIINMKHSSIEVLRNM